MKRILSILTRCCQALVLVIGLASCLSTASYAIDPGTNPFNINEDDLNKMMEALNELTPDQLKELEDLGHRTEERMRSQNLDPNNPNDWMKFMESEGLMAPEAPPKPEKRPQPTPQPPRVRPDQVRPAEQPTAPMPVPVRRQADTKALVNDLIDRIESLKSKAVSRASINKQLGTIQDQVDRLTLYLNLVSAPDTIALLSTKEFEPLHGTLEELHKGFMSFEPSISARERSEVINEDDPYEVLDLPYSATAEDIEARYADLAAERSPQAIQGQLGAEGCTTKACKRIIKTAERTFRLIKQSYETLKNPETRAEVDKTLSDKIAREASKEQISLRAFDQLFAALNQALVSGRVVASLEQLLEKHKPQELEQAKLQQQREKEAYERSKRRVIVPQVPVGLRDRPNGKYDQFYRKMGQERYGRPTGPRQPMRGRPTPPAKPPAKPTEKAPSKPPAKPTDKKEEAKKKEEPEKEPKKKADAKPVTVKPTEKDYAAMGEIGSIGKLLEQAEVQKGALKVKYPIRTPAGQEEWKEDEYKLVNVMHDVRNQITSLGDPAEHAPARLKQMYEGYKLEELRDRLMKIAPGKGKKLSEALKEPWKAIGAKYDKLINTWNEQIFKQLDPYVLDVERHNPIRSEAKKKQHNLHLPRIDPWKAKADKEEGKKPEGRPPTSKVDLGEIRDTILSIKAYYDNINEAAK